MFVLKFTDFGLADVKALPKNVRNALKKELLKQVSKDPTGCSEGLSGPLRDFRSFHFGSHRVVYRVFEDFKAVTIVGIGAHSPKAKADIYRKLEALAETGSDQRYIVTVPGRGYRLLPLAPSLCVNW